MHSLRLSLAIPALFACSPAAPAQTPAPVPAPVPVERALLDTLSLEARVAQLVMPWITGTLAADPDPAMLRALRWVDSLGVGGIIVSIGPTAEVAAKLNMLQQRATLPLLVASDLEGGTAFRLTGGTAFPTNMGVGATGDTMVAYAMGRITAEEARAVGIHLTFSPVADVNNNPDNPIINTRSFGEDPAAVARMVAAAVRGTQDNGVLATVKHFPGHGDTGTDSHITLPVIAADWARLDTLELVPFRAAIDAGVAAVMSAHVAMPALTGGSPVAATLSPAVVTGILRDSLGFGGLAVTDALNMGALVEKHGGGEAAVLALEAGADILLQPGDPVEVVRAVVTAVRTGRVSEDRVNHSVAKLLAIKARLGLMQSRLVDLDRVAAVVGSPEHQAAATSAAERAIVLVRDSLQVVRGLRARTQPVTVIQLADDDAPGVGAGVATGLERLGYTTSALRLPPSASGTDLEAARALLVRDQPVVVVTSVRATAWKGSLGLSPGMAGFIAEASASRPTVLVSLGSPYLLRQVPGVHGYLLAWAPGATTEGAVARALAGRTPITGRLPISLPGGAYPLGWGITEPAR